MNNNYRVLVFGDSLAYGAWDEEGGWVERLKRMAHRRTVESAGEFKMQVLNMGIGGDTSSKILARVEAEIAPRQSAGWTPCLIFSYGVNDERTQDGSSEISIAELEKNTKSIITIAKKYTDHIIFLEMPPIPSGAVIFKGKEYSDSRTAEYESKIKSVAKKLGADWLPAREKFEQAGLDSLYSYDNLHPNDRGHEILASIVAEKLGLLSPLLPTPYG
ncbi:SGNH/GDSL hydrolase family protein [Candidatus Saccharibacteria bacterium]|nr:SGNH/GDSL hydrolase family protein [Candidatus Saccharibacteria bacterium]